MDLTSNLLPFWNKSASFAHKKPVWELPESAVENGQEVTRDWGVNWKNTYVSWILFSWSWASDRVMSANRKPRTKYVRGQNERLFQPHPMGVFEIILYSLYISKVFFFPQMHTWGKAKAFRKQSINPSSFIAMSGHQYLWDCAGKMFYWNSANLYTSFIEFRGYDPFHQQRKPLRSPNLWDHIVYLGRLKLSITEGGAAVICMLYGWICMLTELARRPWCWFFFKL